MKVKFRFNLDHYQCLEEEKPRYARSQITGIIGSGLILIFRVLMLLLVPLVCITGAVGVVGFLYFWSQGHDLETLAPFMVAVILLIAAPVFLVIGVGKIKPPRNDVRQNTTRQTHRSKQATANYQSADVETDIEVGISNEGFAVTYFHKQEMGGCPVETQISYETDWSHVDDITMIKQIGVFVFGNEEICTVPMQAFPSETHFYNFFANAKRYKAGLASNQEMETGITDLSLTDAIQRTPPSEEGPKM